VTTQLKRNNGRICLQGFCLQRTINLSFLFIPHINQKHSWTNLIKDIFTDHPCIKYLPMDSNLATNSNFCLDVQYVELDVILSLDKYKLTYMYKHGIFIKTFKYYFSHIIKLNNKKRGVFLQKKGGVGWSIG
jgi:hypothetical protein